MLSSIIKLKNKIVARLLDEVYVERLDNPIDGRIAKLEYQGRKGYVEKKGEQFIIYYSTKENEWKWIPDFYDFISYEDAIEKAKKRLKS